MSHTPGPWTYAFYESGGYDCMYDAFDIEASGGTIAEIDLCHYGQKSCNAAPIPGKSEAEANARLIAAAPDLLAALKELYALVLGEAPRLLDEDSGGDANLDLKIEAAITKAKGEA